MKKMKTCHECKSDCYGKTEIFRDGHWYPLCSSCCRKMESGSVTTVDGAGYLYVVRKPEVKVKWDRHCEVASVPPIPANYHTES